MGGAKFSEFFGYYPVAAGLQRWGVYATSFGERHVPAGHPYTSAGHPENHWLTWEKGRVLNEYQLLYIGAGRGQFESKVSPLVEVEEGSLLILFPGVWHRYRPDPETGWEECWLELRGAQVEELHRSGILRAQRPVHRMGAAPEVPAALAAARRLAEARPPGFEVKLGLLGLQILTQVAWPEGGSSQRIERVVREALKLLAVDLERPLSPERIAKELHVGYSYFRRAFKARTGFSPKQYRLEIRFRRACDFLRNTDLTLKEIAPRLGYDSAYHLSLDFKKRAGLPPQRWRVRNRG